MTRVWSWLARRRRWLAAAGAAVGALVLALVTFRGRPGRGGSRDLGRDVVDSLPPVPGHGPVDVDTTAARDYRRDKTPVSADSDQVIDDINSRYK